MNNERLFKSLANTKGCVEGVGVRGELVGRNEKREGWHKRAEADVCFGWGRRRVGVWEGVEERKRLVREIGFSSAPQIQEL